MGCELAHASILDSFLNAILKEKGGRVNALLEEVFSDDGLKDELLRDLEAADLRTREFFKTNMLYFIGV